MGRPDKNVSDIKDGGKKIMKQPNNEMLRPHISDIRPTLQVAKQKLPLMLRTWYGAYHFFLNLILVGLGVYAITLGVVIICDSSDIQIQILTKIKVGAILLLVAALVTILIVPVGWIGAIKDNSYRLFTFIILVLIVLIVQFVGIYFTFKSRTEIADEINVCIEREFNISSDVYDRCTNKVSPTLKKNLGVLAGVTIAMILIQILIVKSPACCHYRNVKNKS